MHDLTTVQIPDDHEDLRVVQDPVTGLRCVIAVHSTRLGPGIGGLRHTCYDSLRDAVADAQRLSAAMTRKTSLAGLPVGGGKAVLLADGEGLSPRRIEVLAQVLNEIGGRYVAAEDIGTSPVDMDALSERTHWVTGLSPSRGGYGDPSPATAQTVFAALHSATEVRFGRRTLGDTTATVVGVGKVGADVARRLAAAGAVVSVADIDVTRATEVARELDGEVLGLDDAFRRPVDLLVPCARGGYITRANVDQLGARVVCGAANNILAHDDLADRLHTDGVLYVPDFAANTGGIIHVTAEFFGWDTSAVNHSIAAACARIRPMLDLATAEGIAPLHVANRVADERLTAHPAALVAA
jgi:leucine dehydrogenase